MHAEQHRASPVRRASLVMTGAVMAALWTGGPASANAADEEAPQLSIGVDDGRSTTSVGERLDYTVTVRNTGTTEVTDLRITQSAPQGQTLAAVDSPGAAATGQVSWVVDLAPRTEVTFRSTMTVADTGPALLRLASVACARTSFEAPPVVCASDSNQLPAGAAAEAASTAGDGDVPATWSVVGGAGLLAAAVSAVAVRRRATRR